MKKYIVFTFLFLPLFASASFDKNLYYGLRNDVSVTELQELLTEKGFYSGPITGNFYSLTLKAVKDFQTANSITPVSGYFGPLSRAKANSLLGTLTDESGTTITNPTTTTPTQTALPQTTQNSQLNTLNSVMAQIAELQKQINLLLNKNTTTSTIPSTVSTPTAPIVSNTTPTPIPSTTQTQPIQQQVVQQQIVQQQTIQTPKPILVTTLIPIQHDYDVLKTTPDLKILLFAYNSEAKTNGTYYISNISNPEFILESDQNLEGVLINGVSAIKYGNSYLITYDEIMGNIIISNLPQNKSYTVKITLKSGTFRCPSNYECVSPKLPIYNEIHLVQ